MATGKELNVLNGHTGSVNSVAFSNDGTQIVSGSWDDSVWVWDVLTAKELNALNGHTGSIYLVAFSNDGMQIVSGSRDKSVMVWDVATGKELNVLNSHTSLMCSVKFSTDGAQIVSGSYDHSVQVWDTHMQPRYIREHTKPFNYFHPTYTGWLLSPDRQAYLMFVPLDAWLPDSFNILTIPNSAASSVDFTNAAIGSQWNSCYTP